MEIIVFLSIVIAVLAVLPVGFTSEEDGFPQRSYYRHRCLPVRRSGKYGSTKLG